MTKQLPNSSIAACDPEHCTATGPKLMWLSTFERKPYKFTRGWNRATKKLKLNKDATSLMNMVILLSKEAAYEFNVADIDLKTSNDVNKIDANDMQKNTSINSKKISGNMQTRAVNMIRTKVDGLSTVDSFL